MSEMPAIGFTGGRLNRADALRHDAEGLAAAMADPAARLLVMDDYVPAMADGRLGWTALPGMPSDLVLLGLDEGGVPHFAAITGAPARGRSFELIAALHALNAGEAATYAAARSVLDWHARHGFCANCGGVTRPFRAGWGRACPMCGTEHFPRTDPVVIMIAEHEGRALLGRQPAFPPGRYSALAGFLEPGESIEEAVAREVAEEAGVVVRDVRYVASQPWPFPSSLMIACIARADSDAITLDTNELEDAIWVTKAEMRAALAGEAGRFVAPPAYAIAHDLMRVWAGG
ncbi:NAD+ diphosphatase [Sphingomonas carotinifaciens]|uniref:NAD(+) diphosphatase n=2 Tax=Sphingomonas carotinifaciens TaxID=1166323 RepID=A0A1G7KXS5_9SPHN|nr:NAD+ diphosphatase [Sphingomonas carotinifaciens]SDF42062.1 NAD+ diphosphatase [Sphingomonas carotinifaciens]